MDWVTHIANWSIGVLATLLGTIWALLMRRITRLESRVDRHARDNARYHEKIEGKVDSLRLEVKADHKGLADKIDHSFDKLEARLNGRLP